MPEFEKKNVTLHLNAETYNTYVEYCKKEGWVVSRQIEKLMEKQMSK